MRNLIPLLKKSTRGTTFIELLLYIAIFLILTPILLSVAINSLNSSRSHNIEKQVNQDSQFAAERIYDLITSAKKVDVNASRLNDSSGKISLVMQDDSPVVIELNPTTSAIDITENGVKANLSSTENKVQQLYFEKIDDNLNFPDLALGINLRMKVAGQDTTSVPQSYVISANLERGDYDGDGCLDTVDAFPYHPECCKDQDADGMCDELDNCVLQYNPFQEDYDADKIGDSCDRSAFFGGGTSASVSTLGSFNCASNEALINLIYSNPPPNPGNLKNILMSSSPLSSNVLSAIVSTYPLLPPGHVQQIFTNNTKLPSDVYTAMLSMGLPNGIKNQIVSSQNSATTTPATTYYNSTTKYQTLNYYTDAVAPATTKNRIKFSNPDYKLCAGNVHDRTDLFVLDVENGSNSIDVKTETSTGFLNSTLTTDTNSYLNTDGFTIEFREKVGNAYAITVTATSCTKELKSFEINFGTNANILNPAPTSTSYSTTRYTSYCAGGCSTNCGDIGTGVVTNTTLTDTCYMEDLSTPEWCAKWDTFVDNNANNSAYVGGTQVGTATAYWEKRFKTVLSNYMLQNLKSITVGGQVAYQSITQFFCDTLAGSCPMNATLVGTQDVQLYNYATSSWVTIGSINASGTSSDQNTFEIVYNGANILNYFDTGTLTELKARIKFKWNGVAPVGTTSAPSFMLIDYFTVHLKW